MDLGREAESGGIAAAICLACRRFRVASRAMSSCGDHIQSDAIFVGEGEHRVGASSESLRREGEVMG